MKAIIIEDNPITALDLSELLEENRYHVLKIFHSAEEFVEKFHEYDPDVLLVDITLGEGMNGIELMEEMSDSIGCPFIYLTALSDRKTVNHLVQTQPSAYLTKPYNEAELIGALEIAVSHQSQYNSIKEIDRIFIKAGDKYEKVWLKNILYVVAEGSYCNVFTTEKKYILSSNMSQFCNRLNDKAFLRIHRSYMVNLSKVDEMDNDHVYIDKTPIPIGRQYRSTLKNILPKAH